MTHIVFLIAAAAGQAMSADLLLGVAVTILLASIPWAMYVSSELAAIKKDVAGALSLERRVRALELGELYLGEDDS